MPALTPKQIIAHQPLVIAGPCAVESKAQITQIAEKLSALGVKYLRSQLWKPRSSPDSFQGVGLKGLPWLKEIKQKYGLKLATEIVKSDQIAATRGVADVLWVGARNMQNYELLKDLKKDSRPVILKRGLIATLDEWLSAAKYIGLDRVILCERGVRSGADSTRFTSDFNTTIVAKVDHKLPVVVDPSHSAGRRDIVPQLACAAIAAGADGVIIEVHNQPSKALSDADQQITLEAFEKLLPQLAAIHEIVK